MNSVDGDAKAGLGLAAHRVASGLVSREVEEVARDTRIEERFRALPPEAQREILDLMAFLEQHYRRPARRERRRPLRAYAFVGLWRGRDEMEDGVEWVRTLRRREWRE